MCTRVGLIDIPRVFFYRARLSNRMIVPNPSHSSDRPSPISGFLLQFIVFVCLSGCSSRSLPVLPPSLLSFVFTFQRSIVFVTFFLLFMMQIRLLSKRHWKLLSLYEINFRFCNQNTIDSAGLLTVFFK